MTMLSASQRRRTEKTNQGGVWEEEMGPCNNNLSHPCLFFAGRRMIKEVSPCSTYMYVLAACVQTLLKRMSVLLL